MHLKLYLLVAFIFVTFLSWAQSNTSSIMGTLKEESGEPAAFVAVLLLNKDSVLVKSEISGADGSFKFLNIKEGTYRVTTSSLQYQPLLTEMLTVKQDETRSLGEVTMMQSITQLKEVQVTGARQMVEIHPDKAVFNIDGTINSAGNDGIDLLSKAPGVMLDNNENLVVMGKSGVIIYIDGKRSQLSGDDLIAMLRSLRSENIDAIEIITNPSAKYDAEGNAGIINIRMKRDLTLGWNGTAVLGFSTDLHNRYNGGLTLNNRGKKYNVFGSYSYYDNKGEQHFNFDKELSGLFIESRSRSIWKNTGHDVRIGADWYINKNHTIGVLLNGTFNDRDFTSSSRAPIKNADTGVTDQVLIASNDQQFNTDNPQANLNYQYKGNKGSTLNVDLDYGEYSNAGGAYQPNYYYDATEQYIENQNTNRNDTKTDITIESVKLDYETKIGKGSFGAGFKFSSVKTNNVFAFYNKEGDDFVYDDERSNTFDYEERITAAYINYGIKLGEKVSLNTGVRMENTYSLGELTSVQQVEDSRVERKYTNLFPNVGLTYEANKQNKIGVSFARRIDRPNYQSLNPFEYKLDELNYVKGNPFLQPQYTNVYQITYSWNSKLNMILNYSVSEAFSARVLEVIGDEGASLLTPKNIADAKNVALNISYPFDFTDWWNLRGNLNTYYAQYDAEVSGDNINLDVLAYNASIQNTISLPKDFKAEISAWYSSPSIWSGTIKTSRLWAATMGVRKSVLKSQGQLSLSVSDVFNTQRIYADSNYGGMKMDGNLRFNWRRVIVGFSYRFGNQKVRAARNRRSGLEEERSRLSDGQ